MRRPIASSYLGRMVQMAGEASLWRSHDEGRLGLVSEDDDDRRVEARLKLIAKEDRAINEEARALAQARGWPLAHGLAPYGWARLKGGRMKDALGEVVRVLDREIFELSAFSRELAGSDDEVSALASRAQTARHALREAILAFKPQASLPGAK
jgi:hypothetical protein